MARHLPPPLTAGPYAHILQRPSPRPRGGLRHAETQGRFAYPSGPLRASRARGHLPIAWPQPPCHQRIRSATGSDPPEAGLSHLHRRL